MKRNPIPCQKNVFVCLNEREVGICCAQGGSAKIHTMLKAAIKERGVSAQVRVSRSGCLNQCALGPNVMVFPDNVWFSGVTEADVPDIVEEILSGIVAPE